MCYDSRDGEEGLLWPLTRPLEEAVDVQRGLEAGSTGAPEDVVILWQDLDDGKWPSGREVSFGMNAITDLTPNGNHLVANSELLEDVSPKVNALLVAERLCEEAPINHVVSNSGCFYCVTSPLGEVTDVAGRAEEDVNWKTDCADGPQE